MADSLQDTIYFSIVSHNQTDLILENFADFPRQIGGCRIKTVIVDNTGCQRLEDFCRQQGLLYYHDGIQRGFGSNHNHIFAWLNPKAHERFVICNPDISIEKAQLAKIVENSKGCDIYAPLVYFDRKRGVVDNPDKDFPGLFNFFISFATQKRLHYGTRMRMSEPGWISGAFMLFRASVFRALQGFDEDFFMYCEDIDICYRARALGYKITVDRTCYIEHQAQMHSRNIFSKNNLWHIKSAFRYALKHNKVYTLNYVKGRRKRKKD